MSNIVSIAPASREFSGSQLQLIKQTVAADTNASEFDLFVTVARNAGLDPFRKQISAIVFSKNDPKKRKMSIITTIDGLRVIAARSGRYRPDENEPEIEYDPAEKSPTNPLGIVKAVVRINIADSQKSGGWRPVAGVAYWSEFAPVKDEWGEGDDGRRRPTGKQTLDGNWPKMGRVMISKCAEAQALRKAFPEDMSSLYEAAEMDQARASDFTPSEIIDRHETSDRLERLGAANAITMQFGPNEPLEQVPLGKVADRTMAAACGFTSVAHLNWFESANTHPLREFWARAKSDALALKQELNGRRAELEKADADLMAGEVA